MDPKDFTVGWICALFIELAAARGMLDEEYDKRQPHTHPLGDNDYTLGRIGTHKVVFTCLPAGGTTTATAAAIHMRYAFPNLKFGLMVGIGGGVPSDKNDIRLGDVVVSDSVIQYDSGKFRHDGEFAITHKLAPPPTVLLNAKNEVAAKSEVDGNRIMLHLEKMYEMHPKMKENYGYPGQKYDRLFKPDYFHQGTSISCETCDDSHLVQRPKRTGNQPLVYHGTIASGNAVMKDGVKRDELGEKHGAMCFEMEAAGLMNDFPCLIIRGICDYADSHKNDGWHRYAAVAAAAYAKDLLYNMPASLVVGTSPVPRPSTPKGISTAFINLIWYAISMNGVGRFTAHTNGLHPFHILRAFVKQKVLTWSHSCRS